MDHTFLLYTIAIIYVSSTTVLAIMEILLNFFS